MSQLTRREREICEKLCLGWTSKEIAEHFGLSPRTVEDHRFQVMTKYKVRNAVELVRAVYGIKEFGPTAMEAAQ
ncbi:MULTISPECIES: helix-turn-helix transcriptional regulator [unclassified Bradyrhizobium]|uniref:LuxR C-terminal-related transcriptional regulator n=1 Tax=unclassified Bradyrhizobium TaxID=2631580 RepID=UPI002479B78E|nr:MULTISPECIES: helix-turn-helix transcriptional regulator [unclassified Bradyrhizobium]WGR74326.1 helix-turn-helix transcriptional regulator [Bradyrhizobium sp. ISRA426]WGR79161.1 helix-turn-helix transcriptional regulator [Bradyrhizobium sp. ISRA430]WGR90582.1 helix-turn-helix transcriptional regulator [Bradyrhizobium sp. ISRA432]